MIGKDEERGWLRGGLAARLVWRVSGAAGGRDMIFGRRPLAAIVSFVSDSRPNTSNGHAFVKFYC